MKGILRYASYDGKEHRLTIDADTRKPSLTGLPGASTSELMLSRLLFLCSGNYYRSRFAEHLFNWLAPQFDLEWRADSRGLLVGQWGNIGPISQSAVHALSRLGVPIDGKHRDPQPVTLSDFVNSEIVVAVKESEHRPVIDIFFPEWTDRVEYWNVDDLDCATPEVSLPHLEKKVRALVTRLQEEAGDKPADSRQAS